LYPSIGVFKLVSLSYHGEIVVIYKVAFTVRPKAGMIRVTEGIVGQSLPFTIVDHRIG
jgi:hypothetical protein